MKYHADALVFISLKKCKKFGIFRGFICDVRVTFTEVLYQLRMVRQYLKVIFPLS